MWKRMTIQLVVVLSFVFVSSMLVASTISFEDLANQFVDPYGYIYDSGGPLEDGYWGFNWSSDKYGDENSDNPYWASLGWHMFMPGIDGLAYMPTTEFSMMSESGYFDILNMNVGSYFYNGQDVYAAGFLDGKLMYDMALVIDNAMWSSPLSFNFFGIDHFALWSGEGGSAYDPAVVGFAHELCVDNISYNRSEPVPEPATMILLGSGLLGLAGFRKKIMK